MTEIYTKTWILKKLVRWWVKHAMKIKRLRHKLLGTLTTWNLTKEKTINHQKELLAIFLSQNLLTPYIQTIIKLWSEEDTYQDQRKWLLEDLYIYRYNKKNQHTNNIISIISATYNNLMPILHSSGMQWYMTLEKAIYYTRQKIIAFAQTSGTTSGNIAITHKFIPISQERIQQDIRAMGQLINHYLDSHPNSQLFDGLGLTMGSVMNSKTKTGYISGVLTSMWAGIVGWCLKLPSMQTASIANREEKKIAIMQEIIDNDTPITSIAGVMMRGIDLIKDFKEKHWHKVFIRYFGDLELVIIGGAPVGTVIEDIESLFEDYANKVNWYTYDNTKRSYINTYNASEWFFAFQTKPMKATDTQRDDSMQLLTHHGIVYHFIDADAYKSYLNREGERPGTIGLDQVEKDKKYALSITNPASGLWNYEMGDVVSFTNTDTFQIKVMGRVHESSNVANEHMEIPHIEKAFAALGINPKAYTIGVKNNGVGQPYTYQFFVEWKKDMTISPEALQEALQEYNLNYDRISKSSKFTLPEVYVLPEWSIQQYMSENGKIHAQTKIPRLRGDTKFTDELEQWLEKKLSN